MTKKFIPIIFAVIVLALIGVGVWWYQNRASALSPEKATADLLRLDMLEDSGLPVFEMPLTNLLPPIGVMGDFQIEMPEEPDTRDVRVVAPTFE